MTRLLFQKYRKQIGHTESGALLEAEYFVQHVLVQSSSFFHVEWFDTPSEAEYHTSCKANYLDSVVLMFYM